MNLEAAAVGFRKETLEIIMSIFRSVIILAEGLMKGSDSGGVYGKTVDRRFDEDGVDSHIRHVIKQLANTLQVGFVITGFAVRHMPYPSHFNSTGWKIVKALKFRF
jgi:hypothetical protein